MLTPEQIRQKLGHGLRLEHVSIGWMSIEGTASVLAGIWAGSLSLLAFGGDSFIELLSAYAVANYLTKSRGRGQDTAILRKTERVTGALLLFLIPTIGFSAAYSFFSGVRAETSVLGIMVAVAAVIIMPGLWLGKKRIGEETGCLPLRLDAMESATCFLMSITLLAGLLTVWLFGLWWFDYLATAIILAFVGREAFETYREPDA